VEGLAEVGAALLELLELWAGGGGGRLCWFWGGGWGWVVFWVVGGGGWGGGAVWVAFVGFAAGVASLWDMDYSRRLAQFGRKG